MIGKPVPGPAGADAVAHVFVDALDDECEVTGPDGHHLERVRRITPGEVVTAADGSGAWRAYEVADASARRLGLVAIGPAQTVAEPRVGIALAVALSKGGLDDVIAQATELGVERVIPVRTERAVVRWDADRAARAVVRLRTVAREAAMQSRRVRIPAIDDVVGLSALVGRPGLVVADIVGHDASELALPPETAGRRGWTVLVGPEGGLSADELEAFAAVPRLPLGLNVLRAVTAPLAAVAILGQRVAQLLPD